MNIGEFIPRETEDGEEFIPRETESVFEASPIDWEEKYNNLYETFSRVCGKYGIDKCDSCAKYRKSKRCDCGKKYCEKCYNVPSGALPSPRSVKCALCNISICQRCTAIFCECGYYLCRQHNMYECTANCGNLICDEHIKNRTCALCQQPWCSKCIEGHNGCDPTYCSCGELVYPAVETIAGCEICGKTSCNKCELSARKHFAHHSMMPFLMISARGELPADLPAEILVMIWKLLLVK